MNKRPVKFSKNRRSFAAFICVMTLVLVLVCVLPVLAADTVKEQISAKNHINVQVSNTDGARFDLFHNNTYYIKFDGGGLSSLHITNNPNEPFGQVTNTTSSSGFFYVSDTGGRGFDDDLILMLAVQGKVPADFKVNIRSDGYRWVPVPVLNQPPDLSNMTYTEGALNETFTGSDFIYAPQAWKPAGPENYPLIEGEDMKDPANTYSLLFVDLNVGALGSNSNLAGMRDNGAAKVEYSLENMTTKAAFNIYSYNDQSNQGQGISWSNRVSDTGSSGYDVYGSQSLSDFTPSNTTTLDPASRSTPAHPRNGNNSGAAPTSSPASQHNLGLVDTITGWFSALFHSLGLSGSP
ncbi:nitroreductase [Methanosphaerula palustris E1-9c]|uniref:Nitroreductase n=1 Tax=Methanosphaerula palustris (strain ATCC BAA-1556 / DSM 19958 / E1-9c) TaxID=521011 RepID=B8GK50_METPE|nr:nitroreductase [Methanosphaerula palustris E1-9c]